MMSTDVPQVSQGRGENERTIGSLSFPPKTSHTVIIQYKRRRAYAMLSCGL